jgi:CRISPR-associated protein Csb1
MVSEIVGINATTGVRSSSRIDPLGIQLDAGPLFAKDGGGWTQIEAEAKQNKDGKPVLLGKEGKPSEANHGNVKPDLKDKKGQQYHGGVTIEFAEQTIVVSLAALRRLRFSANGKSEQQDVKTGTVDTAGRAVLAALAICAATLADESGLDLRSRCLLFPEAQLKWTLLDRKYQQAKHGANANAAKEETESDENAFTLDSDEAIKLLNTAVEKAKKVGLTWRDKPLALRPGDELVKLVAKSQQLAVQKGGEE